MFARKGKSSDVQASISRFTDLNRDCVSRVKHLKILLDTLTTNEKRQLLDEHSFETFHLVDELLLVNDVSSQIDSAIEAESGLWTLEQVLCLAPELVGSGWQRHAIESLLKKAVYPKNLMAVRKIAIRLFLVFYQCLGVYGKATPDLDRVFQCLLPFFPLKSGENAEDVLNEYCQSSGTGDWCERLRNGPIKSTASASQTSKERAQMLQVYLDKFLEYCTRETVRIEWNDEGKRQECANFIIDKVIKLYMGECFTELETNGVDVFGGWEGADETGEPLDTADPVVIARYWLIRWINNIASATHQPSQPIQSAHASLLLYRNALFSSHKATNVALTIMREAMKLPLACSNVTHKVVNVLSSWLLQYEIPPFVASGEVSIERCSLLLSNILLSFFHSPYLPQCGERYSSAISIAFAILTSCKQLVSHRIQLPKPLPQKFWSELMSGLCAVAAKICHQSDIFSQHVSAAFTSTLVSNVVMIKAVRRIEIDDDVWDELHEVMKKGVWIPMAEQWAAIVNSVTRALILHLAHIDIFSREEAMRKATEVSQTSRRQAIESANAMMEEARKESSEGGDSLSSNNTISEDNVFHDTDDITNAVTSWSGDKLAWLQTWRRVISLVDPYTNSSAHVAIDCMSLTIKNLLSVNLHPLAHWLACRLVTVPPILLPRCVPALSAILNESSIRRPPPLLSANILLCFIRLMQSKEQSVVPAICGLSAQELSIVAPRALEHLPKMLHTARSSKDSKVSSNSLKLFSMLSSSYPGAEQILLDQLVHTDISENAVVIVNTLAILIVQKAQIDMVLSALKVIENHQFAMRLIPLFCSSIATLSQFSSTTLLQALLRAASLLRDERTRTEIEWQMVKLCVQYPQPQMPLVIRGILADRHMVLHGELVTLGGQFPVKGFEVERWNSGGVVPSEQDKTVYVNRQSSIISIASKRCEITARTVVGRHLWDLDTLDVSPRKTPVNVTNWLRKEALKGKKPGRESQGILGAMDDPFDDLPRAPSSTGAPSPIEGSAQFASMIETSRRQPQPLGQPSSNFGAGFTPNSKLLEWRSLSASLGFVPLVSQVHTNFLRDLKHLDQTSSREVHKVAVIYATDTQQDRASILSNTSASPHFDAFVSELGWEIRVGRGHEGYNGGLPVESRAPYYADAESECIFHVSTWLNGDVQQKWKHIGNDEVHVVWTENYRKVYTRETIATKFCDVLIVLEHIGDKFQMVRVRVDTTSSLEFGPLFDGALVTMSELSQLKTGKTKFKNSILPRSQVLFIRQMRRI
uniref:Rap-GAP domain-containing protein n=1 Tax=Caenorhabditis tropicalis TaxID=1561998 RepID=A0A1I7UD55_9PELO